MSQQQLQQQQQSGARLDTDSENGTGRGLNMLWVVKVLTREQQGRIEMLNAAWHLTKTVEPDGASGVNTVDLLAVAQYIETGVDPWKPDDIHHFTGTGVTPLQPREA